MSEPGRPELSPAERRALLAKLLEQRAAAHRTHPVSFAQARLWFLDRFQPGNPAYNLPFAARLPGVLDPAALQEALTEIVRRHDALRTTFGLEDGRPVQIVAPAGALELAVVDLRGRPAAAREAELQRLVAEEIRQPFDLGAGPLIRAALIRLADVDHALVVVMHHIVSDGWSLGVFQRELAALYQAASLRQPSPLPPLPIQYADYAAWQARRLTGPALEELVAYWRGQLAGARAGLDLATDHPRPPVASGRGATVAFAIERGTLAALTELAHRERATLFMVLLAAWNVLVHHHGGETDLTVGSPIANRMRPELEGLIGFFVNTLVLRTDLSGDPTFRELVRRVREVTLAAYAHQDLPFEKLVEELQPERNLGLNPFFQVMFAVQHLATPAGAAAAPGAAPPPDVPWVGNGTAKFDLTLSIVEGDRGAHAVLEYSTDLFEPATIEALVHQWRYLLQALPEHADQPISRVPLVREAERRALGAGLGGPAPAAAGDTAVADLGGPAPAAAGDTVVARVAARAAAAPDAPAIAGPGVVSYGALAGAAARLAAALDPAPGEPIAILLDRSAELAAAALAVCAAGGACVVLEPGDPAAWNARLLGAAGATTVVTSEALADRAPPGAARIVTIPAVTADAADAAGELARRDRSRPDGAALVLPRPDAEGARRPVVVPHAVARRTAYEAGAHLTAGDRILWASAAGSDTWCFELFGALSAGACAAVVPDRAPPPRKLAVACRELAPTIAVLRPRQLAQLAREFPWALRSLRTILCDDQLDDAPPLADRLAPEHRARARWILTSPPAAPLAARPLAAASRPAPAPIGPPVPGVTLHLLGPGGAPVPPGGVGALHLAAPGGPIALGAHARRRLDGAWVAHERAGARAVLHGAGGVVAFAEIEAALAAIPGVREAAVGLRAEPGREPKLAALIVAREGGAPAAAELAARLARELPAGAIPAAFTAVAELPRRAGGAIDRVAVAAMLAGAAGAAPAYVAPRGELEQRIALLWAELLGLPRVGIHDDFFRIGGHSLLATQAAVRLAEGLGIEVPLRLVFETPNVAGLAAALERLLGDRPAGPGPAAGPPLERAPRDRPLPLSFAQQRLWFLDQLEPGTAYYNMPAPLVLPAGVDAAVVRGALAALIQRHESLRTTFAVEHGEPVQVVAPEPEVALAVHDLSALPPAARDAEVRRHAQAEAQAPFDLARGPLIRGALLQLGDAGQLLMLTLHHIISDGWSMDVLTRELRALVAAHAMGRTAQLPPLPIQYADFAVWQRRWLSGEVLERQLAYWKAQLGGAPALLELPLDRPRPAVQTFRGAVHTFTVPAEVTAALKQLAAREQATLFMTLLAGFQAMLYRYTRQADLLVGTPIANRMRPELEGIIGFFANTLVLRTRLEPAASFAALLAQVRDVTLGAYAHQDLPFEKLVEELHPARSLAYHPLFQVMFVLQNAGRTPQDAPAADDEGHPGTGFSKFDLSAFVAETASSLTAVFEYNTDLFEPATIARMAGHFVTVLASAAAEPDRAVHDLAMLSTSELAALERANATEAPFDPRPVHARFAEIAARAPDAPALVMADRTLSYGELARLAGRWARRLTALGVGPDVPVGISLPRSPEQIAAVLAVLAAGGAYVPLDPIYPPARVARMREDAGAAILIDEAWLAGPGDGDDGDGPPPRVPVQLDHLAYIIYTSGSTGRPKGIAMPHRALANLIDWQIRRSDLPPGARTLQFASLSFDVSFQEIFATLCAGGTLVLVTEEQRRDAEVLWRLIADVGLARLFVPYVALQQLAESAAGRASLPTALREVIVAGEQLQITPAIARLFTRLGARLCNQYGPSETHVVTEHELTGPPAAWRPRAPIGRPIANAAVHVLDPQGGPVPIGVAGELCIGGGALARGYIGNPGLTAERFVASRAGHGRLYRTGDRARLLPDGTLEFLGRLDEQLKIRGYRIEPGEIELALAAHPAVQLAGVAPEPDGASGLRLVAYVQHHPGAPVSAAELRAHLAASLPEPWIPSRFVVLDALPLTPTGKLDRRALPGAHAAAPPEVAAAAPGTQPGTPIEQGIARIWCDLLRLDRVSLDEDFFDLGGHSLLATRLISRIRDDLAAELPLRLVFEAPTVRALALAVVQARAGGQPEDDVEALLAELEAMSDADAGALLGRGGP